MPPFPLPFSSMETLHLYDDRPGDPNHVYGRLQFDGVIDRSALETAVEHLAARQPLLRALAEEREGKWYWVQADVSPNVIWYQPDAPAEAAKFDLQSEVGFRLHVLQNGQQVELLAQMHHALMDGAAAIQLLNGLLKIYDNLVNGQSPDSGLKANDPDLLRGRNRLDLFSRRYLRHLYKQPVAIIGAWNFIFRRFVTLIPENEKKPYAGAGQVGSNIHGEWLPASALEMLNATASEKRITLNSLLMAKLFRTIHYWRSVRTEADPKDWFRVILPMNARSISDRKLPATNRSTMMVVDRRKHHMDAWEPFLQYLDREVRLILNWQLQRMFLLVVRCMSFPKSRLVRSAKSDKPRGTIFLTNLGMPFRWSARSGTAPTGNLILTDFDFVGPVRANTPINFSVQKHGDRLRLSMHFDPGQIEPAEAKALFADFRHQLTTDPKQLGQ